MKRVSSIALLSFLLLIAASCGNQKQEEPVQDTLEVRLYKPEVNNSNSNQFVYVDASSDWVLSIEYSGEDSDWAGFEDEASGSGNAVVTLSWDENPGEDSRSLMIKAVSGDLVSEAILVQLGAKASQGGTSTVTELNPDPVPSWIELPSLENTSDLYFFTHDMTIAGKKTRNYSFALDPKARVSVWVAYPLNRGLISSGSRTNAWGFDPKVPRDCQATVTSAFRGYFERGHQLPSADRYNYDANVATFYGTNMTPQRGELNEIAWATLEGMVRNWSYKYDTLYVVTGCDIRGSRETVKDVEGKDVTIPDGYFKALLGYKKNGLTGPTYNAIAFYFEHKEYDRERIMSRSMTVDALEEKLGMDFFVNLPDAIGIDKAQKVESTIDSSWN